MTDTTTAPETHKAFPLAFPKDFNGEKVTSVTLRRPTGREIRAMQNDTGSQIDRTFKMMATLADREIDLFDALDGADLKKIDKWLEDVLGE